MANDIMIKPLEEFLGIINNEEIETHINGKLVSIKRTYVTCLSGEFKAGKVIAKHFYETKEYEDFDKIELISSEVIEHQLPEFTRASDENIDTYRLEEVPKEISSYEAIAEYIEINELYEDNTKLSDRMEVFIIVAI